MDKLLQRKLQEIDQNYNIARNIATNAYDKAIAKAERRYKKAKAQAIKEFKEIFTKEVNHD